MSDVTYLPEFVGNTTVCGTCGPARATLEADASLDAGEMVTVTCDGSVMWQDGDDPACVSDVDRWASKTGGDWRIHFLYALRDLTYQRQPQGWVLVAQGPGYA